MSAKQRLLIVSMLTLGILLVNMPTLTIVIVACLLWFNKTVGMILLLSLTWHVAKLVKHYHNIGDKNEQ